MIENDKCIFCGCVGTVNKYTESRPAEIDWTDGFGGSGNHYFKEHRKKCTLCRANWSEESENS